MPTRPCLGLPGKPCGRLTQRSDSRCDTCAGEHGKARDARRGNRHQRGYGKEHTDLREAWRPAVEAGKIDCSRCGERIAPGQAWALDHADDRSAYRGPSHATCNNQAGGQSSHSATS